MRIRFYNSVIYTPEETQPFPGEIWVNGDRIECVLKTAERSTEQLEEQTGCGTEQLEEQTGCGTEQLEEQTGCGTDRFDEQIDCGGNLLMPGFKNCHAHGPMTFLRSYADDLPLQQWLNEKIFPAEALLTEEDIYALMQLAVMEYLKSGITTSFEMYFYPEMIARACLDMGFRVVICGTVLGKEDQVGEAVRTLAEDYEKFHEYHALVDYRLGFHSEYSCCRSLLREITALCRQYHAPVYMHNSETKREVLECIERNGVTPVALMEKLGLFEYGGAGHHMIYTTDEDREILKRRGIYVVTNPSSNLKLASGIAPIRDYLDAGIQVAIGTDGPASNNSLNFFKEMYLTAALQKVKYQDPAAVSPEQVLQMAVRNGARLLGLMDADGIAAGKLADLVLIDLHRPNMQPSEHIMNNLVYSGSIDNVLLTMVGGQVLYRDGVYPLVTDPEQVYRRANRILQRISRGVEGA